MKLNHEYLVELQSEIPNSFRTKMACDSLDINIEEKSKHKLLIEGIKVPNDWSIGLILGASGSGKTTLAKEIFGDDCFDDTINESKPIIDQLPKDLKYNDCANLLSGIGLTSVPCWVRPVYTLSNGQKARAKAVLQMTKNKDISVIDEWTSVVDRQVAKVMSHCVQKFARRNKKKIVLCSCHYDILEWLNPDWVIDCNDQKFYNRDLKKKREEQLEFTIKEISKDSWRYFSKYHYLSKRLPGGKLYLFGLFDGEKQIGFQCFANYVPIKKNMIPIYHSNRTVIHPDYQGFGLGLKLINATSKFMKENYKYRIMAKFSSLPIYKSMSKNSDWKLLKVLRTNGKMKTGGNYGRNRGHKAGKFGVGGFREGGVRTFSFEYFGK